MSYCKNTKTKLILNLQFSLKKEQTNKQNNKTIFQRK